jgi:hypothetical protein
LSAGGAAARLGAEGPARKEGKIMKRTHLLTALCGVALLSAAPAFAQSRPAGTMGSGDMAGHDMSGSTNRPHMMHHARGGRAASDTGNGAVDDLNNQSLQAAQAGQDFTGGGAMAAPAGGPPAGGGMGGAPMPKPH